MIYWYIPMKKRITFFFINKDFFLEYFKERWITFVSKIVNRLPGSNAMSSFSGNGIASLNASLELKWRNNRCIIFPLKFQCLILTSKNILVLYYDSKHDLPCSMRSFTPLIDGKSQDNSSVSRAQRSSRGEDPVAFHVPWLIRTAW